MSLRRLPRKLSARQLARAKRKAIRYTIPPEGVLLRHRGRWLWLSMNHDIEPGPIAATEWEFDFYDWYVQTLGRGQRL